MNPLLLALTLVLAFNEPVSAQPKKQESNFDKLLKSLFTPRTKDVSKPKRKPSKHISTKLEPRSKSTRTVSVDTEWMARYWEMESAWDYPIPEDILIKWKDGKYIVPITVLKHYEDMDKTPRRIASPQSDARPGSFFGVPGDG